MDQVARSNFNYDTDDLWQKDRDHIIHPWVELGSAKTKDPLVIAESDGPYIFDSTGNRMLDAMGGMWCVNVGYGREEIAQAIADQARRLCYFSPFGIISSPPSIEFGDRLVEYAPGDLKQVFFTTGGSTAVDSAIRYVYFYFNCIGKPEKKHVITREYAYHGSTYLSASLSGKPSDITFMDRKTDTIHHLPAPNPYRRPEGMTEAEFLDEKVKDLENKILELGSENVAAFIAEPVLASGGVIVPPDGYQKRTLEVCRKYDVLYISDEVVTGFGRCGEIFASEPVFDIVPDIITCAKGLTSGYVPLGAFFVSSRIYEPLLGESGRGKYFANGFTYSAHPVACAAGLANLDIIEREDICGHVRAVGPYFQEQFRKMLDLPMVGDVRGVGMMLCIEFVKDKKTKEICPAEWEVANRIIRLTMKRGLMIRPMGHLAVLSPTLIITKAHVDEAVAIMTDVTKQVMDDLRREGLWNN
jgi:adenosylmethionine-8-amino-7-oxononanoate aminotransferase